MGMIDRFIGMGPTVTAVSNAATGLAEVFTPNSTRRMELDEDAHARAVAQLQAEFAQAPGGWFDGLMNGMNRLPRPLLTLGTIGLFVYAMVEPAGFSRRMEGLALVPEPLWWLMGAIVSFYFGAREAHYFRGRVQLRRSTSVVSGWKAAAPAEAGDEGWRAPFVPVGAAATPAASAAVSPDPADDMADNAALRDWRAAAGRG